MGHYAHNRVGTRIGIQDRVARIIAVNIDNLPPGVVEEITVKFEDNGEVQTIGIKSIKIGDDVIK